MKDLRWDGQPEGAPTRLRDLRAGELEENAAWAVDLLRDVPAHRLKPGERQRVLLGLGRARVVARRPWAVRLAATLAVLVAATAIARAGLGHFPRWLTELSRRARPTPQADVRPTSRVSHHRELATAGTTGAPQIEAPAPAVPPALVVPVAPPAPVALVPRPTPPRSTRPTTNAKQAAWRSTKPAERGDGDAGLVVQAMRALRRDDDPALARALATTYLERHPFGALAEEALALSIEAAVAQHEPDASGLAARYLRQYPDGPFRGLARRASRPTDADSP